MRTAEREREMPESKPDPEGRGVWEPRTDSNTGRVYWVNHARCETKWEPPATDLLHELPEGWEKKIDSASGKQYFVDHKTKQTHWQIPAYLVTNSGVGSRLCKPVLAPYMTSNNTPVTPLQPPYTTQGAASSAASRIPSAPYLTPGGGARPNAPAYEPHDPPTALPSGWRQQVDHHTGKPYYINDMRKETRWDLPSSVTLPPLSLGLVADKEARWKHEEEEAQEAGSTCVGKRASVYDFRHEGSLRKLSAGNFCGADVPAAQQRALQFAECVVCFDDMYKEAAGVFVARGGSRVCTHYLHFRCAHDLHTQCRSGAVCPICRRSFEAVRPVPDINLHPSEWFEVVDFAGKGSLERREVLEALKAQLPIDYERLEAALEEKGASSLWAQWDISGDGTISKSEFLDAERGLLAHIRREFHQQRSEDAVPDIRMDKGQWFDYFDYDKGGSLSQDEIVRALVKTFKMSEDRDRLEQMQAVVAAVWAIFDSDGSGEIDREEFASRDGLADSIIASMA